MAKEVFVIDSMMGSGKSTWSIQYMNKMQKEGKRFIYVTPYLDEVERVKKECGFAEPEQGKSGKLDSFKTLISQNKNVATTHALFKMLDQEAIELLSVGYTLVLDEVLDVIQESSIPKGDIDNMVELNILKYIDDKTLVMGDEEVVNKKANEDNKYKEIAINLLRKNLELMVGKKTFALMWLFPLDLIEVFEDVFILTFMFDGYPMKGYLDKHNITQFKKSVVCANPEDDYEDRNYKLVEYFKPDLKSLIPLIKIADKGKINDIGERDNTFTYSYWEKLVKDKNHLEWINLRKNINNYLKNFAPTTSSKKIIWTTFTKARSSLYSSSLKDDNFVANNIRATNDYKDMNVVLYLVDKRYNPIIEQWFKSKNIKIDENLYALGECIQMIWRSSIREGKEIYLYIPSKRMRELLEKWLIGKI